MHKIRINYLIMQYILLICVYYTNIYHYYLYHKPQFHKLYVYIFFNYTSNPQTKITTTAGLYNETSSDVIKN